MFTTPIPFHHRHQHSAAYTPRPGSSSKAHFESSQIMSTTVASDSYFCPAQNVEQQSLSPFQRTVLEEQETYFKTFPAARLALEEEKARFQSQLWRASYVNAGYLPGWGFQLAGAPSLLVDPVSHTQSEQPCLEHVPSAAQEIPSYGLDQGVLTQHVASEYHPSVPQIQNNEQYTDYAPSPEYPQSLQETANHLVPSSTDVQSFNYNDPYGGPYDQPDAETTPAMDSLPSPLSTTDSGDVHGAYPSPQQVQQQAFYLPTIHLDPVQSFSPPAVNQHLNNYAGDLNKANSLEAAAPAPIKPIKDEPEQQQAPLFSQQQQLQLHEHDQQQHPVPVDIEQHPQNQVSYVNQQHSSSPQQYQQQHDHQQRHEIRHRRHHHQQQQHQYNNTHLVSASPTRRRHHHSSPSHGQQPYTHPQQTHVHRKSAQSGEVMFNIMRSSSLQGENQIQKIQNSSPVEWTSTNASGSMSILGAQLSQHVQDSGSDSGVAPEAHAAAVHAQSTSASSSSPSSSPQSVVVLPQHRIHATVNATATATLVQNNQSQATAQHEHEHQHHIASPATTATALSSGASSLSPAASVPSQHQPHQPFPIQIPIVVTPLTTTAATRTSTTSSRRSGDKKPMLACIFCRGRKIACGLPSKDGDGKTCNQCQRRSLKCVYPTESRRGMRKKTPNSTTLNMNPMPKVTNKKR